MGTRFRFQSEPSSAAPTRLTERLPFRAAAQPCCQLMVGRLLLVDPDPWRCELILRAIDGDTHGDWCTTYEAARTQLLHGHYDLLVTNVRLDAYNGLQLVYLAQ